MKAKILKNLLDLFKESQINELARSTGFIKRNRKFDIISFISLMVFESRDSSIESLNALSIQLSNYGIRISKQGINQKFTPNSILFMKALLGKLMSLKLDKYVAIKQAKHFGRIMLKDSTSFQLPSGYSHKYLGSGGTASKSGIKFQYEYDLKGSSSLNVDIQCLNESDCKNALSEIRPNDLCLEDLGYFTLSHFKDIIKKEAYFLSRFKYNIAVYCKNEEKYERIALGKLISKMGKGSAICLAVFIGHKEKIPVRLILERVPDHIAASKRRKLKGYAKQKGKKISTERLCFCDVNAYITNADEHMLPLELIRSVYSLRWQIELMFKTWKSTFKLDKIKPMKLERFECITYGTLIKIILCTKLFSYYKTLIWNNCKIEISELKAFKYLIKIIESAKNMILNPGINKHLYPNNIPEVLISKCRKEKKKGKLTPMMILSKIPLN